MGLDLSITKAAAELACGIYDYPEYPHITWDYRYEDTEILWGIKTVAGIQHVCFAGTRNLTEWISNVEAIANPLTDSKLGPVHPGFYAKIPEAWSVIAPRLAKTFVVEGHSRGAAHATLFAATAAVNGKPPMGLVTFGEPRSGFKALREIVGQIPGDQFRNGSGDMHFDPISQVPVKFWPEEYVSRVKPTDVSVPPPPNDPWPFDLAFHHMQLYRQALLG